MKMPYGHGGRGHSGLDTQRRIEQGKYHHKDMLKDGGEYYYRSNKSLVIGGIIGGTLLAIFIIYVLYVAIFT